MDILAYRFPVSGVDTWIFLPPLVMFLVAAATSMGGVTGAFILLPFNMSVLGYTAPGVSATNFVYNIVAIPVGVIRHLRSRRLSLSLLGVLVIGTLPGVFLGYYLRVTLLPDPARFKPFVGAVLAYLAFRVLSGVWRDHGARRRGEAPMPMTGRITGHRLTVRSFTIETEGESYERRTAPVLILSLVVGVVGGAYGIGGGAVMAPFLIAVLGLPPFVVAGASLLATWITSVAGALIYAFVPIAGGVDASPDWLLGILFGIGGMAGVYVGARIQGKVPVSWIKAILGLVLLFVAVRYLWPPVASLL